MFRRGITANKSNLHIMGVGLLFSTQKLNSVYTIQINSGHVIVGWNDGANLVFLLEALKLM